VTPLPELVALLYRADWTQLCLSARITSQHDHDVDDQLRQHAAARRGTHLAADSYTARPDEDEPDEDEPDEGWRDSEYRGAAAAAALAVGGAIAGAVAVTGWLEKHRARCR
jgi:hypothetical protein